MNTIERRKTKINSINISYLESNPESKRTILFLHGFPETSESWREYIEYFSNEGFRVLAPDQRGYNDSDGPPAVKKYKLKILARDMVKFIQHKECAPVVIVAHDWGGVVAWYLTAFHPELVSRLIVLNAPHWLTFKKSLLNSKQFFKSWYMLLFRVPLVAEKMLATNDYQLFIMSLKAAGRNRLSMDLLNGYKKSWPQKMSSMLNWYRAMDLDTSGENLKVLPPTLLVLGEKDPFINYKSSLKSLEYCEKGSLKTFKDGMHFLQHEEPKEIQELIKQFIS
jgi:pimeloyl-ACP methyl ester carboxylesterase